MRLLDLFCGVGGASMGYRRAGWDVLGVDIETQPDYPFPFIQGDAATVARDCAGNFWISGVNVGRFDAVHHSPPCQASCTLTKGTNAGREYVQLIPTMRELVTSWGLPSILENVQGSEVRRDMVLCGEMFGLGVLRHRYFELSGFEFAAPAHKPHRGRVRGWRHGQFFDGPYLAVYGDGGGKGSVDEWQTAMGINWTDSRKSIAEAIPPAYTEHIGRQLLAHLEAVAA